MAELSTIEKGDGAREEKAIRHLAEFTRYAWPVVEPGRQLVWNWHLDIICKAKQRQIEGDPDYRRLLICIPPGTMKSLIVSVFAPAWEWLQRPERRKLFLANDKDLTVRDSRKTREIITSDRYARLLGRVERFHGGNAWELAHDQNEKTNFENTAKGFRQCRGIDARITGKRGDDIDIDDPIDAKEVLRDPVRAARKMKEACETIDVTLPSRVNELATARWTLIMQRVHEDDPAGQALKEGDWHVIVLAMEYDPAAQNNHPDDPRVDAGELLFPGMFPADEVARLRRKLGPRHYAAQYQQAPTPAEGALFQRQWMIHYREHPRQKAGQCQEIALSVDCAFKGSDDADFVTIGIWGRIAYGRFFLLGQIRGQMNYPQTKTAIRGASLEWPQALLKLVERKANGQAIIDDLGRDIPGIVGYDPKASKEARAQVAALAFEAGNVELPSPEHCPWVLEYIEELCAFPMGSHDDQVDQTSQILIRWTVDTTDRSAFDARATRAAKPQEQPRVRNVRRITM